MARKVENNKNLTPDIKKLKILFTVVHRSKELFYIDLLEQYEVNMQTVVYGHGTSSAGVFSIFGIREDNKAIIISIIKEEHVQDVMEMLTEKFEKVKNGKGVAFTVPMKSIIGVSVYQFLINNQTFIKEAKVNE